MKISVVSIICKIYLISLCLPSAGEYYQWFGICWIDLIFQHSDT